MNVIIAVLNLRTSLICSLVFSRWYPGNQVW